MTVSPLKINFLFVLILVVGCHVFYAVSVLGTGYYFTHFELSPSLQEIPEKNHMTSCKQNLKLACLTCNPSLAQTHSGETNIHLDR